MLREILECELRGYAASAMALHRELRRRPLRCDPVVAAHELRLALEGLRRAMDEIEAMRGLN